MKGRLEVKEWIFDKIEDEMKKFNMYLAGEYVHLEGSEDINVKRHDMIRVEEVLKETEKAFQIMADAETVNGHAKAWKCWIPKSAIINGVMN